MAPKTAGKRCPVQQTEDTASSVDVYQETGNGRSSIVYCTRFTYTPPPLDLGNIDVGAIPKEQAAHHTSDYVSQDVHTKPTTADQQTIEAPTNPSTHDVETHPSSTPPRPSQDQLAVFIHIYSLISTYLGSPDTNTPDQFPCPLVLLTPTTLVPVAPRVTMPPVCKVFLAPNGPDPGGGYSDTLTPLETYENELAKYCSSEAIIGEVVAEMCRS